MQISLPYLSGRFGPIADVQLGHHIVYVLLNRPVRKVHAKHDFLVEQALAQQFAQDRLSIVIAASDRLLIRFMSTV